ncbi:VWA domain-containing protein [Natrinema sp. H-ect4]|uniref:vWA domain-containing protein n=1 Tax=Natrinema sp. H-ect4 TaxID=3242699 RepID=UPI0035A9AA03
MVTSLVAIPALASGPSATANERSASYAVHTANGPGTDTGPPSQNGDRPPGQSGNGPPGHDRGDANVTVPDLEENTTVEATLTATERLGDLEIENDTVAAAAANDTVSEINASLQEYRGLRYVDSRAAFEHLAEAQRALAALKGAIDGDDAAIVDEISEDLYAAIDVSARRTVSDATVVVAGNDGEFSNPGQRQKAESALGNAIDSLERADRTVSVDASGNGNGKRKGTSGTRSAAQPTGPADRAKALTHLENAWKHAERALDTVEANTEPRLSLSQGQAFERNGSVLVPVRATLDDARPYAYDDADVAIGGDGDADGFTFVTGESTVTTARGMALVDVGSEPRNVTVTVTSTAAHDTDRTVEATHEIRITEDDVSWERPDPDEYRTVEVENETSGVAVAAGGDGLHETDVSISDETPESDDVYRAGPMVRIENARPIDEATVEIPIDEDALDEDGNLSIVTWDPTSDAPWTPVETEIDRDTGVATAEVDHFSFFSVFRIEEWEDETSDTITLDGNQTDGDVNNGSEVETADFVFVIDESGSMGGSPIHYAELAGKRFVGALTDDERAGRVGYASGANLDQPLTSDHDAVNSSLERLSAGGGTDTEAGLRVGLDHLEENSWENRSEVMILLSDGNSNSGSYPRSVAEDAADAGVEISTVGLGNGIDENELREIAAITGGDFYHVEREEDLPDTFERVAENQTGPDLQDTNGDGIPDLVAEMDLSMPTGEPGVVGEPLNLSPTALDTSGDGILDNETVDINYRVFQEDNKTKLHASVTYAKHHPARIDTTGDGLTDAEQLEGWEIEIIDNHDDATEMLEMITDPDDERDPATLLTSRAVEANPLLSDTSGNGLSDARERDLGTDPKRVDTTGDGIADDEALELNREDPTIFTTTPPSPILVDYSQWSEASTPSVSWEPGLNKPEVDSGLDWYFQYQYRIEDAAGIAEYELSREGDRISSDRLHGATNYFNVAVYESFWEGAFTALRGSESDIYVEDVHGNAKQDLFVSQTSFYGERIDDVPGLGPEHAGMLSGFTHSGAELPELLYSIFIDDGVGDTAAAVEEFLAEADTELLAEIVRGIPESTVQQQRADNPYTQGTNGCSWDGDPDEIAPAMQSPGSLPSHMSDCEKYAVGFYTGYVTHFISSFIYGGTITQGVSESTNIASRLSRVSGKVSTVSLTASTSMKTSRVTDQFLRAKRAVPSTKADRLIREQATFGSGQNLLANFQRIDTGKLAQLPGDELRQFLVRNGEDGADLMRYLDADAASAVLRHDPAAVRHVIRKVPEVSRQADILSGLTRVSRANHPEYASLAVRHGEDFTEFANRFGDDAVTTINRIGDPADQRRLLSESRTRTALVDLQQAQPQAAQRVFDLYNSRATNAALRLGDDASIEPLIRIAQQSDIRKLQLAVTRGDRTVWIQTPRFDDTVRSALPGFDRDTATKIVQSVVVSGSQVDLDDGTRYTAASTDLEFDLDGDELVITTDGNGTITSFERIER